MRICLSLLLALVVVAAGCGDDGTPVSSVDRPSSTSSAPGAVHHRVTTTVLESPDHGPQLCLGVVLESYPPQCSGPDVIGWDWDAADGAESANGTTWGDYTIVGTWDGEALTLTEPPRTPEPPHGDPADGHEPTTPCPPPEGGWQVVDPATATEAAMTDAIGYARSQPDVGGVWLDQSINPAAQRAPMAEMAMNDPTKLVLNLAFTGDLERHEAAVREIWGGALCISRAPASTAELEQIRQELHAELEHVWSSSIDEVRGRVVIGVTVDDGLQRLADERYGAGVVEVRPALEPIER